MASMIMDGRTRHIIRPITRPTPLVIILTIIEITGLIAGLGLVINVAVRIKDALRITSRGISLQIPRGLTLKKGNEKRKGISF